MRGVTLLWVLRSPCNLNCQYCYFGTLGGPQDRTKVALAPGMLSHTGQRDLSLDAMLAFISTFTPELVRRVFVAGGEPLIWRGALSVLRAIKQVGCEVIVCTNGLPLRSEQMARSLLDLGVDAVSISLDSFDATYNDHWRQDRSGQGWQGVVEGIQMLVRQRHHSLSATKIGVYSVISRENISHIAVTGQLVADLGVDYYIIQPIALSFDHVLHDTLTLSARHREAFIAAVETLKAAHLPLHLPHPRYLARVVQTLSGEPRPMIPHCFGGRDLFFIEPDGSLWDCPSMEKIAQTGPGQSLSIPGQRAETLFSLQRRLRNTDCRCFSQDCVNMWQLMLFDDILHPEGGAFDDSSIY